MSVRRRRDGGKPAARNGEQARARVAVEAARIMAEEGVRDFQAAKRKAVARLNLSETRDLPTNEEIDAALADHLQLFHGARVADDARRLRTIAAQAMSFLAEFEPRLVGPVLAGTVTPESQIQLHVSADTPEQVGLFLLEHGIPYRMGERRIRFGGDRYENVSTYEFVADGAAIEICVFDPRSVRETPLSPVDGRPMRRAALKEVERLLG
ncbi:MAG TPA: hypothetical protein VIL43_03695 [Burkholderiales bacterium]